VWFDVGFPYAKSTYKTVMVCIYTEIAFQSYVRSILRNLPDFALLLEYFSEQYLRLPLLNILVNDVTKRSGKDIASSICDVEGFPVLADLA
jgi:hypothetical protein